MKFYFLSLLDHWPLLLVDGGTRVVVLKGHKWEHGKLMLNIRESAKDPNSSGEIWIEQNQATTNQMNLAVDMCIYFDLQ